jgi:translation initiation factor IF-2
MTEETKKEKKLTLGGGKLSLGAKSLYPNTLAKPPASAGSVVIEVKKGRASTSALKLSQPNKNVTDSVDEQDERRLAALRRSITQAGAHAASAPAAISTLSKIAELNQVQEEDYIVADHDDAKVLVSEIGGVNADNAAAATVSSDAADAINAEARNGSGTEKAPSDRAASEKPASEVKINQPSPNKTYAPVKKDKLDEKKILGKIDDELDSHGKPKTTLVQRKLKKTDILTLMDDEEVGAKKRSFSAMQRAKAKQMRKNEANQQKAEKIYREVILPEVITVAELASRMSERGADVIRELMKLGIMATSNHSIDADTAELVATTLGHTVKRYKESDVENVLTIPEDQEYDLTPRAPIVTIMGHVDHGKTSLLDALKSTDVAAREAGGITQHIGAYSVTLADGRMITFIDTPGHEAFTEMRTRGAQVTDIVVLVVAADDGIKMQTIEAINHAKAANVPIIVAINKIDKPGADEQRVKNELLSYELVPEELGGDIITVGVSAKERLNLDKLEEAILLVAEMQSLRANPNSVAAGVVIEARVDTARGVVATVIVQRGTLKQGDLIMAGTTYGRIKRICNDKGITIKQAGPSLAVEVFGFDETPMAGDKFNIVSSDKQAREIIDYRLRKAKELQVTASKTSLEDLFLKASGDSKVKDLPIIIKADVHGSLEAIVASLNKIHSNEVKIKILHKAVGAISDSDIALASASKALVIGFNVRSIPSAANMAEKNRIDVRYYSIIYNLVDDVKAVVTGMLSPIIREVYIGSVDIRDVFNITKVGKVAGSYVTRGIIKRGAGVRLLRDNIVIHEGKLKTLKRFKDDVKEVREGYECGIAFENYDDIKIGDTVEVFEIVEEKQKL